MFIQYFCFLLNKQNFLGKKSNLLPNKIPHAMHIEELITVVGVSGTDVTQTIVAASDNAGLVLAKLRAPLRAALTTSLPLSEPITCFAASDGLILTESIAHAEPLARAIVKKHSPMLPR